ncbi:MAG: rRNA (cytidine1920-2-O)/16S rRNA (cytidine1409-2-O)-methyltransferase [Acidimicrobiaceae bacterium]|jgi:23S rRNA (cytidine1920-2'-O)/16S rRNA (cytidine1409-2'-O)-methyltransferase|nr:rRNA (cytidine1920-2-O)/16S rRNA (cytidine1409-2-O)-methyltransferase [Acidimicrobiaceae bacterium]MDQ1419705.1 rRNA (cytidine1920-2-O)/16S rRNA (cytidine1409-2-O)-methyltransferase [Acidimicrobiaceae bacterium]
MSGRRRLDVELVRRGLVGSREQAQAAVAAGDVLVGGAVAEKPSRLVHPADPVTLAGPPPRFVSRGGLKLDAALERFAIDVGGRRALDAGASTGGFTDCLLQHGAATVVAVDVGRGQLHERLAADARVDSRERTNIRHLTLDQVGGSPFEVIVADLSFISLRTVAPVLVNSLSAPGADIVTLIKPQFEAGRQAASIGRGVIRDPAVWSQTLLSVIGALIDQGAAMMGLMVSPLTGADGNVEFLAHLRAHAHRTPGNLEDLVDAVVAEATAAHGMEQR